MLDFSQILEYEPAWVQCACGASTMRVPCWDCASQAERAAEDQRADDRLGIPARYQWARVNAPELATRSRPVGRAGEPVRVSDAVAMVRGWGGTAIAFVGPSGAGKTSLAIACIRDLPGAMVVHASQLERARIEHRAGEGEARLVERALRARVLLVDDLGQDKTTQTSAIESVVNARHDAERPTWYTTGLTVPQIEARYGAGVRRRLTERGTALVVKFGEAA